GLTMKRIILAAVITLALCGQAGAVERAIICAGLKGTGLDWKDGKLEKYDDGYSGVVLVLNRKENSVIITWKGNLPVIDEAPIINFNDDEGWFSFQSSQKGVTRLFTIFHLSNRLVLAMTEHQTLLAEPTVPQSRTFFASCE
ncbi:MAG: hypothetical protein V3R66_02160, partial [Rhodospirillales bacterium]